MEGERLVDKIDIEVPTDYEGVNLSAMNAYANLKRSDGSTDKIMLTKSGEGDYFAVRLEIDASVTAVPGDAEVYISFESDDGTVVFMSEGFTLQIHSTPNAYKDYTDRTPSALHKLQLAMYEYVQKMQELYDEVNAMVEGLEGSVGSGGTGSAGGTGGSYSEENKLPAAYVEGLAAVATSGSYSDLTEAPDLTAYATLEEVKRLASPSVIKYIAIDAEASVMLAAMKANKAVLKEYVADGVGARRLLMLKEDTNELFPVKYYINGEKQLDIYFTVGTSSYIVNFNKSSGSYSFSG